MDNLKFESNWKNDYYVIEFNDELTRYNQQILNYFYQPLIGTKALNLYQFLTYEVAFSYHEQTPLKLSELSQFLKIDHQELDQLIVILVNYQLLDFYYPNRELNLDYHVFELKKPLTMIKFFSTDFYLKLKKVLDEETLQKLYYRFRPKFHLPTNKDILLKPKSQAKLKPKEPTATFLAQLEIVKKFHYDVKLHDITTIKHLMTEHGLSWASIQLLVEFTFVQIGTLKHKYLEKIVKTLQEENILQNLQKIKQFFQKIYQKNSFDKLQSSQKFCPDWLQKKDYDIDSQKSNLSHQANKLLDKF